MRRISGIFLLVLGLAVVMCAQNSNTAKEMNGTLCDSRCVTQQGNVATCNTTCTKKSGVAVFVDDQGSVQRIANQDICKSHMNKHVKMMAVPENPKIFPTADPREDWLRIQDLQDMAPKN